MARPMRTWLAACAAIWIAAAGCGGGSSANPNVAPKITSTPPGTATLGVPYEYTVTVEGMTPMSFSVVSGPEGFEYGFFIPVSSHKDKYCLGIKIFYLP